MEHFDDPKTAARYADGPARQVPGLAGLHRMAHVLLAERAGDEAAILVLGAGGGLELAAFAAARPFWRLTGVDPSPEMLAQARRVVAPHANRIRLVQGYAADAPDGPFDGAACLMTMHFIPEAERLSALRELRARLRPGAALVIAHHSFAPEEAARWLDRYASFAAASGIASDKARAAARAISERLPILSPAHEQELLRVAGFGEMELFYAAFSFRGWVARAP